MTDINEPAKMQELIEKISSLELELEKINNESKHNWDLFIRCKAEVENIKKRTDREMSNISNFALQNILTDFMPIMDGFELCLKNKDTDNNIKVDGVLLIYKMLINTLNSYNLKKRDISENEKYDTSKHEVVSIIPDENYDDAVIHSVLQNGYTLNDRILRYAKVSIIKKI